MPTEERLATFKKVAALRQELTVILENVHDPHNIGAVLRTCDSVGVQEIYVLYTDPRLDKSRLNHFKASATGVKKWMHIHYYDNVDDCFARVKKRYRAILATHLTGESRSIYETDLTMPTALLFGNEHEGVTEESLAHANGNIRIPQFGMVQSLNISVACAVSLYEAARQRLAHGLYRNEIGETDSLRQSYFEHFVNKHKG